MYKNISTAWLFYVLLPVILTSLSFCAPIEKKADESKTMYEILALKCPQLEKTDLRENFKEIFEDKCTNWTAINNTITLSDGITNAQCLVLYESVLSYCITFGDKLFTFKDLMPTNTSLSNEPLYEICNITSFLNDTEHNISDILNPVNCALMCGKVLDQGVIIHNICKLSYFFGTFHVKDFLSKYYSIGKNINVNKDSSVSDVEKPLLNKTGNKSSVVAEKSQEEILPVDNKEPNGSDNVQHSGVVESALKQNSVGSKEPKGSDNARHSSVVESALKQNLVGSKEPKGSDNVQPSAKHESAAVATPSIVSLEKQASKIKGELSEPKLQGKPGEEAKAQEPNTANINSEKKVSDTENSEKSKLEVAHNEQEPSGVDQNPPGASIENAGQNPLGPNSGEDEGNARDEEEQDDGSNIGVETDEKGEQKMIPSNGSEPSTKKEKPSTVEKEEVISYMPEDDMDGDSYFFSYFTVLMCLVVVAYVGYHNRQKILALVLEGKRGKRSGRQSRRPNSANYHKLGSNLEEAISSSCKKTTSNIIY